MTTNKNTTRAADAARIAGELDAMTRQLATWRERLVQLHARHIQRIGTGAQCDIRYSNAAMALERAESALSRVIVRDCEAAMAPAAKEEG